MAGKNWITISTVLFMPAGWAHILGNMFFFWVFEPEKEIVHHWKALNNKFQLEFESVTPVVTLVANDNWLEFTLRYIVDYKKRRATKDQLFELIVNKFEKSGGKVAIASSTLQLIDLPVIQLDYHNRSD